MIVFWGVPLEVLDVCVWCIRGTGLDMLHPLLQASWHVGAAAVT